MASPSWTELPSCISRERSRNPQRGAVLIFWRAHTYRAAGWNVFLLGDRSLVVFAALVFGPSGRSFRFRSGTSLLAKAFFDALTAEMFDQRNRDSISGADVVQKEVTVGMNRPPLERVRMQTGAAGTGRAFSGHDGFHVTACAADPDEQFRPVFHSRSACGRLVPRGRLQRTHKAGEVVDIFEIVVGRVGQAVGLGNLGVILVRSRRGPYFSGGR